MTALDDGVAAPGREAAVALFAVFLVLGAGSATVAARVPAIKSGLHLSTGALGASLLGAAVGLVLAAPSAGAALRRWSPRPVIATGLLVYAGGLVLIPVAGGAGWLFASLVVWGFGAGLVDVGMNTEAAGLQSRSARSIMSRLHAGWSVGGLAGAAVGALAAGRGVGVGVDFAIAAAVILVVGVAATGRLDRRSPAPTSPGRSAPRGRLPGVLVALGVVAFGNFLAEGAANDWSAVYIHGLGAPVGVAALGYTAFSCTMAAGRLVGDHLTSALGPVRLVRLAGAVAASGMTLGLVAGDTPVALVAFGLLGAGLSVIVPVVFSAAASVGRAGGSVATVTGFGYVGLVLGPPLIGGLGQLAGLRAALVVVVVASAASVALAGATRGARPG